VSEKELVDQGVHDTLLIQVGAIVLHKTIACDHTADNNKTGCVVRTQ
jgi:hypothetical protein